MQILQAAQHEDGTAASYSQVRTILTLARVSSAWRRRVQHSIDRLTSPLNLLLDVTENARLRAETRCWAAVKHFHECYESEDSASASDALRLASRIHVYYELIWEDVRLDGWSQFNTTLPALWAGGGSLAPYGASELVLGTAPRKIPRVWYAFVPCVARPLAECKGRGRGVCSEIGLQDSKD